VERSANVSAAKADTNARENSDESVVTATSANNDGAESSSIEQSATEPSAELIEESNSAKRNAVPTDLPRTPGRIKRKSSGRHGVREAARQDSTLKFTALLDHVNCQLLHEAVFNLKKTAAVGIDQVTWHEYERNVEANIVDLHQRIHRGAYRAKPSLTNTHSQTRGWYATAGHRLVGRQDRPTGSGVGVANYLPAGRRRIQ